MKRFPLKLSNFLKVDEEFKVLEIPKFLPKVILFLMWKEVLRFHRYLIGILERL